MDCSHYECLMSKQSVIEKLYFMLGKLVNEGWCVVKCVCVVCSSVCRKFHESQSVRLYFVSME